MTTTLPSHLEPRTTWWGTLTRTDTQQRRWTLWQQNLAWLPLLPAFLALAWSSVLSWDDRQPTNTSSDVRHARWVIVIATTLICVVVGVLELAVALVLWPAWWLIRRMRGKGGAVRVFCDGQLVVVCDSRTVSVGSLAMAIDLGTIDSCLGATDLSSSR